MLRATRSELTRLNHRSFRVGWLGLTTLLTAMFTTIIFQAASGGTPIPSSAPGGSFPSLAELTGAHGQVAGLGAAATILGVVTLAYWAIATASDYSTGLIRLLVAAEPHRLRLLAGKVLALSAWTAVAATVATVVTVALSPLVARATDLSTSGWTSNPGEVTALIASTSLNTFLALVVWGVIGLVIALLTRSAAVAISAGVGYVLVVEGAVRLVAADLADRLPGATLTALAGGGSTTLDYGAAIRLGLVYATIGLGVAAIVLARRDVVE